MIRKMTVALLGLSLGLSGTVLAGGGERCRLAALKQAAIAHRQSSDSTETLLLRLLVKDLASENRDVQAAAEYKLILAGKPAIPFVEKAPPAAKERADLVIAKIQAIADQAK